MPVPEAQDVGSVCWEGPFPWAWLERQASATGRSPARREAGWGMEARWVALQQG